MNIEFDAYKQKLNEIRPALEGLADSLNVEGLRNELERLHAMQEAPGFWDNPEKSQQIVMKAKSCESKLERYKQMNALWDDLMTICEMAAEEDDDSMLPELQDGFAKLADFSEITPWSASRQAQAAPRRRTGARCSTECIPAGQSATASPIRLWTTKRVKKQALSPPIL